MVTFLIENTRMTRRGRRGDKEQTESERKRKKGLEKEKERKG